jgi:hypothetical protein
MAAVESGVYKPLQKLKQNQRCQLKEHTNKLYGSLTAEILSLRICQMNNSTSSSNYSLCTHFVSMHKWIVDIIIFM